MRTLFIIIFGLITSFSCITQKEVKRPLDPIGNWIDTNNVLKNNHLGIEVYDPNSNEIIYTKNADKYFIPASNTKILTLYASLKVLGDSLAALNYYESNDTLYLQGTGDPTFLHPDFPKSSIFTFLKTHQANVIVLSNNNFKNPHWGAGWSWDDYSDDYQVELSSFPIYGNIFRIKKDNDNLQFTPPYFGKLLSTNDNPYPRAKNENVFSLPKGFLQKPISKIDIPFIVSDPLVAFLMSDTLKKSVISRNIQFGSNFKTLYSTPVDTVFRRMMKISDNMLAEQLLLMAQKKSNGDLSIVKSIQSIQNNFFGTMPQKIKWVDGSGLSRYNLITPKTLVQILSDLYRDVPIGRLFSLFATNNASGTLKNLYPQDKKPYIFAKSGSMSGVYNQSGYIVTKKGRVLIFSIMNNNFIDSVSNVRKTTADLIELIHEKY